jgi:CO/xanthine dehydrogenase Mo-binding subunit
MPPIQFAGNTVVKINTDGKVHVFAGVSDMGQGQATGLVQIAADKLGDARVLLDDLDAHRRELRSMRGFKAMSITRAIEAGGITLVSVETRWQDAATLDAYEQGPARAIARTASSGGRRHPHAP